MVEVRESLGAGELESLRLVEKLEPSFQVQLRGVVKVSLANESQGELGPRAILVMKQAELTQCPKK
jgi:hypothetical protein